MPATNPTSNPAHANASAGSSTENDTNTNAALEDTLPMLSMNEEDLADVLFAHFASTFTTRELVQLTSVSKTWASLVSSNIKITTKARLEDDTKDWYFPLRFVMDDSIHWVVWDLRTWHGLHHASLEIHRLPPLPSFSPLPRFSPPFPFPPGCGLQIRALCKLNFFLASSGGLLLIADESIPNSMYSLKNWKPLLVCNPITKAWRVLPEPSLNSETMEQSTWEYWGVQAHLVTDEEENSYTVIVTLRAVLLVYSSTSNSWKSHMFPDNFPWKSRCRKGSSKYTSVPSAALDGKLYYAELEVDGNVTPKGKDLDIRTKGHVRVFEVDYKAGTWESPIRYALKNYFPGDLEDPERDFGFRRMSYTMKIVPCMGVLYAIIPARLAVPDEEIQIADHLHHVVPTAEQEEQALEQFRNDVMMRNERMRPQYQNDVMMKERAYHEKYIAPLLHLVDEDDIHNNKNFVSEFEEVLRRGELDTGEEDEPMHRMIGRGYYCLPMQFYVVPLHGAKLDVGQLLTQLERPIRTDVVWNRLCEDFNPWISQMGAASSDGFRCAARGSTIWVTWWDFLLQYDVVSGESQCQSLPEEILPIESWGSDQPDVSFSPSFHMTP